MTTIHIYIHQKYEHMKTSVYTPNIFKRLFRYHQIIFLYKNITAPARHSCQKRKMNIKNKQHCTLLV